MPDEATVSVELNARAEDVEAVLAGLRAFNVAVIGEPRVEPVHIFLRDPDGAVVGGLTGVIQWRWVFVAILHSS